jgi:hypothetical protein
MLKIDTLKKLQKLKYNNKLNETALVEENHTMYKWNGKDWEYVGATGFNTTLFDINRQVYNKLEPISEEKLVEGKEAIFNYYASNRGSYFMLLSNENKSYTIFHSKNRNNDSDIADQVIDVLQSYGTIKEITWIGDNPVEIWITINEESFVYYFFNYDTGVIECQ